MERDTFVMRSKWVKAIEENLPEDLQLAAFKAISHYAMHHEQIEMPPMVKMAMAFIMPELEEDFEKWMDTKAKRSEAGKRGNEKRWAKDEESQMIAKIANATDAIDAIANDRKPSQTIANIAVSSCYNLVNVSFFERMCAGNEEKKEEILFEIGKKMLRKGSKKPSADAEAFVSYNDSIGWKLNSGRIVSDPVAWADNWSIKNPSQGIALCANAYILLLQAANIKDIKMLDYLKGIFIEGSQITIHLSAKKAAQAFFDAEEKYAEKMHLALPLAFPDVKKPIITYSFPQK